LIDTSFFGFVPLISKLHSFAKNDLIAISQLFGFLSRKNIEFKRDVAFSKNALRKH
jgi:hypothetical protein